MEMNDDVLWDLLLDICIFLGVIVIYGLLRQRIIYATHDFRVNVGKEAILMSKNNGVDRETQNGLKVLVYAAYRPMTPWILLLGLIPGLVSWRRAQKQTHTSDPIIAKDIMWLRARLFFALITTSPLATFFSLCVMLFALIMQKSVVAVEDCISRSESLSEPRLAHAVPGRSPVS